MIREELTEEDCGLNSSWSMSCFFPIFVTSHSIRIISEFPALQSFLPPAFSFENHAVIHFCIIIFKNGILEISLYVINAFFIYQFNQFFIAAMP